MNNNDTGARFITRYGPALTRVATVALLTLPGIPSLYSYDEVGGEFEPYSGLGPFHGQRHPELREFHRRLISLRRASSALRGSGFELLESENESVLAYLRRDDTQSPPVLVILNFSAAAQRVALQLRRDTTNGWLRDWLDPERMVRAAELAGFSLPAFGYAILSEADAATGGRN